MRIGSCRWLLALVVVTAAAMAALPRATAGQTTPAAPKTSEVPRTKEGRPNFQGFWQDQRRGGGGIGLQYSLEEGAVDDPIVRQRGEEIATIQNNPQRRINTGAARAIVDPPSGTLPYQPWALEYRNFLRAQSGDPTRPEYVDPDARCLPGGIRNQWGGGGGYQIVQTDGSIWILYQLYRASRIIPLDGRPPIAENVKLYMGVSRGRWEGDTLVIESSNYNDRTWFANLGDFHSDALRVTERWTMVDPNTIQWQATFDDPKVFTRPWTMALSYVRNTAKGFELLEDSCHEGERDFYNHIMRP